MPEKINDGLEVSSLSAQGIDSSRIIALNNLILAESFTKIHSLLILKNGKLVFEEYYNGYDHNKRHDLRSVTKSVVSALIGIAIDQNLIKSVDEEMFSFFPEYSDSQNNINPQVKLFHLLTMTAGFKWDETSSTYNSGQNTERQRYESQDWLKFILEREMIGPPGYAADKVGFNYCGGCPVLLSAIIGKITEKPAIFFAREFLFKPLGIKNYDWALGSRGITDGASGLRLRPRDMAKLGLLYLYRGKWNGKQIISEQWIDDSSEEHVYGEEWGYGYLWWFRKIKIKERKINYYYGSGNGGQKIMVCPELELVIVLTGGNYEKSLAHTQANQIINNHILTAIVN